MPPSFERRQLGRILVVDDNHDIRAMMAARLQTRGHRVVLAADGRSALQSLATELADLVLLDIGLPDMDGFEVLRRIRQTSGAERLPVIMATARDSRADIVRALGAGANDYVVKPFDFMTTSARIGVHLSLKRAREELELANQRMRQDLLAAAQVQQALLPVGLPQFGRYRFAWRYLPCEHLGGDALGLVPLGPSSVGVYVLDVSGHGVPAALLSVRLSRHFHDPADGLSRGAEVTLGELADPALIVGRLNRLYPMSPPSKHYFTLLYGVLDTRANQFRYVAAGHPGPTLVRANGAVELNDATAIPLGVLEDTEFDEASVTLEPGDRLFVYSDGAYETRDPAGNMIGREVFSDWLGAQSPAVEDSIDAIESRLLAWTDGREFRDDITLLGVEHCS